MKCDCPCKMFCKHEYVVLLHLLACDKGICVDNKVHTATYKTFTEDVNKPKIKLSTEDKIKIFLAVLGYIGMTILYICILFIYYCCYWIR